MVLDESALSKLATVVAEVEKGTAGEIVVVAARRCEAWAGPRAAFGLGIGAIVTVAVSALVPQVSGPLLAGLFPIAFVAAFVASGLPVVLRALLTDDAIDEAVLRAAKVAFVDHGVHRTKDRAGVLVYISILERRVQILGDSGVHKVVGDEGWSTFATRVVKAMKDQSIEELLVIVRDIGSLLAQHFPPSGENPNELPDDVRRV